MALVHHGLDGVVQLPPRVLVVQHLNHLAGVVLGLCGILSSVARVEGSG